MKKDPVYLFICVFVCVLECVFVCGFVFVCVISCSFVFVFVAVFVLMGGQFSHSLKGDNLAPRTIWHQDNLAP